MTAASFDRTIAIYGGTGATSDTIVVTRDTKNQGKRKTG